MVQDYIAKYGGTASDINADVAEAYSVGQVAWHWAVTATRGTDNPKIIRYLHSGVTLNTVQGPGEVSTHSARTRWPPRSSSSGRTATMSRCCLSRRLPGRLHEDHQPEGPPGPTEQSGKPSGARKSAEMGRQIYEAVVDGILVGGVYGLMAVGLTLIFGVLDIINIAQGILVILGAYLSYVLSVHLHIDLFLGLLITVPAMFLGRRRRSTGRSSSRFAAGERIVHVAAGQLRGRHHHRGNPLLDLQPRLRAAECSGT